MSIEETRRSRLVIAGATGFIGRAAARALSDRHEVIGLTRGDPARAARPGDGFDSFRRCDLYSMSDAERALEGADVALYLVHSMSKSARLSQGSFDDFDLLCADNFARAAARVGVRHIVYVGGLLPSTGALSPHLRSRREVEQTLAGHGTPVTTLRAGLVIGPGGSSFEMMRRLVERLPWMLCPSWTSTRTQPIDVDDLVGILRETLGNPAHHGLTHDVGGPEVLTYREMMRRTGIVMGRDPKMLPLPLLTPTLSTLWVSLMTGAPEELVAPLVQSLRHEMVVSPERAFPLPHATPFDASVKKAIAGAPLADDMPPASGANAAPHAFAAPPSPGSGAGVVGALRALLDGEDTVRSVQRFHLPAGCDAGWVAREYARFLPRLFRGLLRVSTDEATGGAPTLQFWLRGVPQPLLELTLAADRSTPDRVLFHVRGGLLAREDLPERQRGRLEFRTVMDRRFVLAALHDYRPRLPWPVYTATQALGHLAVMRAFGWHLS